MANLMYVVMSNGMSQSQRIFVSYICNLKAHHTDKMQVKYINIRVYIYIYIFNKNSNAPVFKDSKCQRDMQNMLSKV